MTNPTPPFKVEKFRERWERIDKTTGEVVLSGWNGNRYVRVMHADKIVGFWPTGTYTDEADHEPPPGGYHVHRRLVPDDTLPDLDISAAWVATVTYRVPYHGGANAYRAYMFQDLVINITNPAATLERLEELRLETIARVPDEHRQSITSVKLVANLTERLTESGTRN